MVKSVTISANGAGVYTVTICEGPLYEKTVYTRESVRGTHFDALRAAVDHAESVGYDLGVTPIALF